MAFTIDQYNAINDAIALGALTIKYSDKEVTYKSLDDMLRVRALIATELGLTSSCENPGRRFADYKSGLQHYRDEDGIYGTTQ